MPFFVNQGKTAKKFPHNYHKTVACEKKYQLENVPVGFLHEIHEAWPTIYFSFIFCYRV
jgi:hypothetical protein